MIAEGGLTAREEWPDPPKDQNVPLVATLEELIKLAPSSPQLWVRAELANTILREQVAAEDGVRGGSEQD